MRNSIINFPGTVCVVGLALSSINLNGTMVVNMNSQYANPIYDYYTFIPVETKDEHREVAKENKSNVITTLEVDAGELFGEIRDATQLEQEGIDNYIKSISKDTGVNFFDVC